MGVIRKILIILSLVVLASANVDGIGCFLYLWGATNVAIGLAAWMAFKFWVILVITSIVIFLLSILTVKI